ncbi:MAG: hypothetical protein IJ323_02855 [Clostridia bacterium]|nr:hypothetical protein [Clostridia bacterium]
MKFIVEVEKISDFIPSVTINDTIKKKPLTDNEKAFLDISLKEYQEIRAELREVIARQNTVLFSSIAQFAALVSLGLTVLTTEYISNSILWASNIFGILIPCLTILLGVIWIDLAYRQITMGCYVYSIEVQVNQLIHCGGTESQPRQALFWEQYNHKKYKVDFISYLCSMMIYLVFPIMCFLIFLYITDGKFYTRYCITAVVFSICVLFIISYIVEICKIYKNNA